MPSLIVPGIAVATYSTYYVDDPEFLSKHSEIFFNFQTT